MPELPEVETICTALKRKLSSQSVKKTLIRQYSLRQTISINLPSILNNQILEDISRRGKYLVFHFEKGYLLIHLGMSGSLFLFTETHPQPEKHDHVDFLFSNGMLLRYRDPRRFGCILWTSDYKNHPLLKNLGIEPLIEPFTENYLFNVTHTRQANIKSILMNSNLIVGVGNIYANEALFFAKVHPERKANSLTLVECKNIVTAIKQVLHQAIKAGGTTLKDFQQSNGELGYFTQQLKVYGKKNQPCFQCETKIVHQKLNQRSTYFCPNCQEFK